MVDVIVLTYNQEQWIRQTLDSILSQKTNYPFEVIIGEDWGTDGTRAICEDYAARVDNVRLAPSDHNLGVVGNWINCIRHGKGKYIMTCAGDDYWHSSEKIQLQIDFMESHPECVICHTDYDELNVKTNIKHININKTGRKTPPPEGRIQQAILNGDAPIAAVTACIRRDAFEQHIPADKFIELQFPREDWPTQLILSAYGDIQYLPVSTATYRIGHESISNSLNYDTIRRRNKLDMVMLEYLYSLFPEWGQFHENDWFDHSVYNALLNAAYQNNDFPSAKEFARKNLLFNRRLATLCARNLLTFKIYRLYHLLKK